MIIKNVLVLALVLTALAFDLRTYKIPNSLNLCGCAGGLIYSLVVYGVGGILKALLGVALVIALMLVPFAIRAIGAGDVKLFCAISAFLHFDVIWIVGMSVAIAAICGISTIMVRCVVGNRLTLTRIHFTIPICFATIATIALGL